MTAYQSERDAALAARREACVAAGVPRALDRALNADHAWPSGHIAYMPEPCAEIVGEWLYPMASEVVALASRLVVLEQALERVACEGCPDCASFARAALDADGGKQ